MEREETFELPAAHATDFFMETNAPNDRDLQRDLMFNQRFHNVDALIDTLQAGLVPYSELNAVAEAVQARCALSLPLQDYAVNLWRALRNPADTSPGVVFDDVDTSKLVAGGASPRGMAMLMRAACCAVLGLKIVIT